MNTITVSLENGIYLARYQCPKIGFVDATGYTKDMALSRIVPRIKQAHAMYMRNRFEQFRDRWLSANNLHKVVV